MSEEFLESEVLFFNQIHQSEAEDKKVLLKLKKEEINSDDEIDQAADNNNKKKMVRSMPMNIPSQGIFHRRGNGYEEDEDEEEMVPPHLIMARRLAGKMTFSMCSGQGRTLKGRDLSRVRNSILRMTGFIEV